MTDETPSTTTGDADPSPTQTGASCDFTTAAATVGVIFVGAALIEVGLIPGMVIGAAAVLAPKYVPKLGATLQPLFRSVVRGAYKAGRKAREAAAEAHEHVQDIMAEVHAEDATPPAAAPAHPAHPHAARPHAARPHAGMPHAEVAHATRGRVRLKIPAAKSNPTLLDQIKVAFEGHRGIDAIEVKPATGSVIIHYDPEHHEDVASLFTSMDQTASASTVPIAPLTAAGGPAAPAHRRPAATKLDQEISQIADEAEFLAEHSHAARVIVDYIKTFDRQLKLVTNNNVDLKILVPVGLAVFTIMEVGVATATPMWVTLMLFSINHFVELHAHVDADKT
jgi:hypothetical protein